MFDQVTLRQSVRYVSVGLGSNLLLYVCYLALTMHGIGHKFSMSIAYIAGVMISFFVNRRWSFGHTGSAHWALARYIGAYLIGYFLNLLILIAGVDFLEFPHQVVQAAAIVVVAGTLFIIHKCWVFAPEERRGAA